MIVVTEVTGHTYEGDYSMILVLRWGMCKEFMYHEISLVFAIFYQLPVYEIMIQQQGSGEQAAISMSKLCWTTESLILWPVHHWNYNLPETNSKSLWNSMVGRWKFLLGWPGRLKVKGSTNWVADHRWKNIQKGTDSFSQIVFVWNVIS